VRHGHRLLGLVILLASAGCTGTGHFLSNRWLDLRDCASVYIGGGVSLPCDVGVEITEYAPVGIGAQLHHHGMFFDGTGWLGRRGGNFRAYHGHLPFNLADLGDEVHQRKVWRGKPVPGGMGYIRFRDVPPVRGWNERRRGRLAVHAGALLFCAGGDVEPIEIVDFLAGWFGLDLTGDDEPPPLPQPATRPTS